MSEADKVFGELARRYAKAYGEKLMAEHQELRSQKVNLPKADQAVKRLIRQRRQRMFYLIGGLAAACLVLAVAWPVRHGMFPGLNTNEEAKNQIIAKENQSESRPPDQPGQAGQPGQTSSELIPLAFSLPENMTVKATMVDQGQSVYLLAERGQDDVVLIMEKWDDQAEAADITEMIVVEINGHQVYVRSEAAYQQLICYQGDLVYRLTCRYDINTLLPVAEKIFSDEL